MTTGIGGPRDIRRSPAREQKGAQCTAISFSANGFEGGVDDRIPKFASGLSELCEEIIDFLSNVAMARKWARDAGVLLVSVPVRCCQPYQMVSVATSTYCE